MDTIWIVLLTVLAILGAPLFAIFGAAAMLLFGALMVLMMVFRPQGLISNVRRKYELAGERQQGL